MAACEAAKEIVWSKRLLQQLTGTRKTAVHHMDNQSSIHLIKNPVFHKRSKHIDVRYHYTRERYEDGEFSLNHVASKNQRLTY